MHILWERERERRRDAKRRKTQTKVDKWQSKWRFLRLFGMSCVNRSIWVDIPPLFDFSLQDSRIYRWKNNKQGNSWLRPGLAWLRAAVPDCWTPGWVVGALFDSFTEARHGKIIPNHWILLKSEFVFIKWLDVVHFWISCATLGVWMCLEDSLMRYKCGVSSLYFMSVVLNAVGSVSVQGRSKIQCCSTLAALHSFTIYIYTNLYRQGKLYIHKPKVMWFFKVAKSSTLDRRTLLQMSWTSQMPKSESIQRANLPVSRRRCTIPFFEGKYGVRPEGILKACRLPGKCTVVVLSHIASGKSAGNRRGGCCHEPNGCGQGDSRNDKTTSLYQSHTPTWITSCC